MQLRLVEILCDAQAWQHGSLVAFSSSTDAEIPSLISVNSGQVRALIGAQGVEPRLTHTQTHPLTHRETDQRSSVAMKPHNSGSTYPASIPLRSSETGHPDICSLVCITKEFCTNCQNGRRMLKSTNTAAFLEYM